MSFKIVFIRSNPVSPDPRVEKEADCLIEAGYNVKILAWDREAKYKTKQEQLNLPRGKAEIYRIGIPAGFGEGMRSLLPFIKFQTKLAGWLLKNRKAYDIIHACDFDTAFTSKICARIIRKKFVFDIFDYLSTNPKGILAKTVKRLENNIINKADGVIICTEQRQKQIDGTKPKRLAVIHNSPMEMKAGATKSSATDKRDIVKIAYVGILQDYRLLLEIGQAVSTMNNIELHIGGFGKYENFFMELTKKHSNIVYYGKLSYDKTLELERNCDIMTAIYDPGIGNHYYAAPNKFYEALMLGKPLIMVANTGMSNVIQDNDIGVLIDYSKDGFAEGLNSLISKKETWSDMSKRMHDIYTKQYSWSRMKDRLVAFYSEITGVA